MVKVDWSLVRTVGLGLLAAGAVYAFVEYERRRARPNVGRKMAEAIAARRAGEAGHGHSHDGHGHSHEGGGGGKKVEFDENGQMIFEISADKAGHLQKWEQLTSRAEQALEASELPVAEQLLLQALQEIQEAVGEEHPLVANTYMLLAHVCRQGRKMQDALALFDKAASIFIETLPTESLEVATCLSATADILIKLGLAEHAEARATKALGIFRQKDDHMHVAQQLEQLAQIASHKRQFPEAEQYSGVAMEIYVKEEAVGKFIEAAAQRAIIFRLQGKIDKALEVYQNVLTILDSAPNDDQTETVKMGIRNMIAAAHRDHGQTTLAEPIEQLLDAWLQREVVPPYTYSKFLQTQYAIFAYNLPEDNVAASPRAAGAAAAGAISPTAASGKGKNAAAPRTAVGRLGVTVNGQTWKNMPGFGPTSCLYINGILYLNNTPSPPIAYTINADEADILIEVQTPPLEDVRKGSVLLELEIYSDEARTERIGTHRQYLLSIYNLNDVTGEEAARILKLVDDSR